MRHWLLAPIAILALLIFLSGCTRQGTGYMLPTQFPGVTNISSNMDENALERLQSDTCVPANASNPCTCMYCDNETNFIPVPPGLDPFLRPFIWYDRSMTKSVCGFYPCNYTNYADHVDSSNHSRFFMIGQGQTFFEFSGATVTNGAATFSTAGNSLCTSQLKMAVRWILGNEYYAPYVPSQKQAACMLQKDVMPLYIYYTGGKNISEPASASIAQNLKGVGPIFITTEANYNGSDPEAVSAVTSQLIAYKRECPNCLTVLAPRDMNEPDIAAVYAELSRRGLDPKSYVDVIGQGFMLNDDPYSCSIDVLLGLRLAFAKQTVLLSYGKPVLWMYVGMSPGPTALAGCNWSNDDIARGYLQLHTDQQAMVDAGIIGVAPYQLVDARKILPCNSGDCNFGLADSDFKLKQPQAAAWFNTCSDILNAGNSIPIVFATNGTPAYCTFAQGWVTTRKVIEEGDTYQLPTDITGYKGISFRCPSCISYEQTVPSDWYISHSAGGDSCTKYQQIDLNAEIADTDPFLLRAVAMQENTLNPCAVSWVPMDNMGCNPNGETITQIFNDTAIYGSPPVCTATGQPLDAAPRYLDTVSGECTTSATSNIPCKPCALGMLQCIEYPGGHYAPPASMPFGIALCGGTKYDPLSAGDSACCGSVKLSTYMHNAMAFIATHHAALNLTGDGEEAYAPAFLGLVAYNGYDYSSWFAQYQSAPLCDIGGSTHTYDNFMDYIIHCHYAGRTQYSASSYAMSVLGYYKALQGCPSNDCAGRSIADPFYANGGTG